MKSSFQHNSIWQAVRFGRQAVKHFLCTSIAPYVNMHLPLHFCQTAFHGHRRYFPNTDGMMLRWCSDSRNKSIKSAHFCPVSIQGSILKSNLIVQTFHFFVMLPTSRIFQFNSKKKKKKKKRNLVWFRTISCFGFRFCSGLKKNSWRCLKVSWSLT